MVTVALRKGPSGPFGPFGLGLVLYARDVAFSVFEYDLLGPNTVEQTQDLYLYPVPPEAPPRNWSVIVNPSQSHVGDIDPPDEPDWMTDLSHSHVRIAENSVDLNTIDPVFPVGTLAVLVKVGMSYVKGLPVQLDADDLLFDVMLLEQLGLPRSVFSIQR